MITLAKSKRASKPKVQKKYIHIHAICEFFEIHEQVEESKAVERLTSIRNIFISESERYISSIPDPLLTVKTVVVNPTMF